MRQRLPLSVMSRVRCRAVLLGMVVVLAAGCQTVITLPATLVTSGIAYPDLFTVVERTVDGEGYPIRLRNLQAGTIESDWRYGTSLREFRGPSRQRVIASINPEGSGWVVNLRVLEEVLEKGGLLATHPQESEDWEPIPDNFDQAEMLVARINATLRYGS